MVLFFKAVIADIFSHQKSYFRWVDLFYFKDNITRLFKKHLGLDTNLNGFSYRK